MKQDNIIDLLKIFVTKDEFLPFKMIVFGLTGAILMYAITQILKVSFR